MKSFLDRLEAAIESHRLIPRCGRVLVAVSAGVDSMVLLDGLHHLAARHGWTVGVAHFNHRLRGSESQADETFVRAAAAARNCPVVVGAGEVRSEARRSKVSLEMAGRTLRHAFLAQAAQEGGWNRIAIAHHSDDQVELFFLRLLRGAGPDGLAGMAWSGPSPADPGVPLVRPLLGFGRSEIEAYAREQRLPFRVDHSNRDTEILRNRIRRRLLPLLRREFQPALSRVILRTMEILREEADFIASEGGPRARRAGWATLHPALKRRRLVEALREFGATPSFDLVDRLLAATGDPVEVSEGVRLRLLADGRLEKVGEEPPTFSPEHVELGLRGGRGRTRFAGLELRWSVTRRRPRELAAGAGEGRGEWMDADAVGRVVQLRHWRAGDRFRPLGAPGSRKLQDLFVDAKVPKAVRHQRVVAVAADASVVWVEGLRVGERVKIRPATQRFLRWRWARPGGA